MLSSVPGAGLLGSHLSWGSKVVEVCPRTMEHLLSSVPGVKQNDIINRGCILINGIAQSKSGHLYCEEWEREPV